MSLEKIIALGRDYFVELLAKILLGVRGKLEVPEGESLVIPSLYEMHVYGEVVAYGEVIAEGDLVVY